MWRRSRGSRSRFVRIGRSTQFQRPCSFARRRRIFRDHRIPPVQFPSFVSRAASLKIRVLTLGTPATRVGHVVSQSAMEVHHGSGRVVNNAPQKILSCLSNNLGLSLGVVFSLFEGQDPCNWTLLRTSFGKSFHSSSSCASAM